MSLLTTKRPQRPSGLQSRAISAPDPGGLFRLVNPSKIIMGSAASSSRRGSSTTAEGGNDEEDTPDDVDSNKPAAGGFVFFLFFFFFCFPPITIRLILHARSCDTSLCAVPRGQHRGWQSGRSVFLT